MVLKFFNICSRREKSYRPSSFRKRIGIGEEVGASELQPTGRFVPSWVIPRCLPPVKQNFHRIAPPLVSFSRSVLARTSRTVFHPRGRKYLFQAILRWHKGKENPAGPLVYPVDPQETKMRISPPLIPGPSLASTIRPQKKTGALARLQRAISDHSNFDSGDLVSRRRQRPWTQLPTWHPRRIPKAGRFPRVSSRPRHHAGLANKSQDLYCLFLVFLRRIFNDICKCVPLLFKVIKAGADKRVGRDCREIPNVRQKDAPVPPRPMAITHTFKGSAFWPLAGVSLKLLCCSPGKQWFRHMTGPTSDGYPILLLINRNWRKECVFVG